jgi:hypothetical protein
MHDRARRARPSIAAISIACVIALTGAARAQSAEAEALFDEGDALMKRGKYAEACEAFEGSNKLEARAGTLIRLGECRERTGQLASAWSAYKAALTRVKDPKKKEIASARVAEIEPKLSYMTVNVPERTRVKGLEITRNGAVYDPVLWNRAVPVDGGTYTMIARALDYGEWKLDVKVPREGATIIVEVPRLDSLRKPSQQAVVAPVPVEGDDEDEQDEETGPSPFTTRRKIALGLGGVAVASGVAALLLGRAANSNEDAALSLCVDPAFPCADGDRANRTLETARTQARNANILFGVGGACLITGVLLWITGAPTSDDAIAVAPVVVDGGTGIALGGRF